MWSPEVIEVMVKQTNSYRAPSPAMKSGPIASLLSLALMVCGAGSVGVANAQELAPKNPVSAYAGWVNARKPASVSSDTWQSIPTGRDASLPAYYDVFWRAVLATEAGAHFRDGLPIRGMADGDRVISIGISQARYDTGSPPDAFTEAKPHSPYIRNQAWDFKRYLWDPAYNAAIGYGYFSKGMKTAAGNNPCLGYAYYNAGPRGMESYVATRFKPVDRRNRMIIKHMANYVSHARRLAGPHANEIEKIIQTSPGCNVGMDDIDPLPPMAQLDGNDGSEVYVLGYCDPKAMEVLTGHYRAQQRDNDDTYEELFHTIKRPYSIAGGSSGGGSSGGSGGGSSGGGNTGGSGSNNVLSDSMRQVSSCVSLSWPNVSFQGPTIDQLIKAAEKEVVRMACEKARSSVADAKSTLNQRFYFNPRVPGVPSSGVSISTRGNP